MLYERNDNTNRTNVRVMEGGRMKVFYMNQGGGGHWGAVRYSKYDLLLLAECRDPKQGFDVQYASGTKPSMSVQVAQGSRTRVITAAKDVDSRLEAVRPLLTFQITSPNIRVVFFHLKSGSEKLASEELRQAVKGLTTLYVLGTNAPILWVGDFNRAADDAISAEFGKVTSIIQGGGYSGWYLDRVLVTGDWGHLAVEATKVSNAATDHDHIGIEITIE